MQEPKRYRVVERSKGVFIAQIKGVMRWYTLGHHSFIDTWLFFEDLFTSKEKALKRIEESKRKAIEWKKQKAFKRKVWYVK